MDSGDSEVVGCELESVNSYQTLRGSSSLIHSLTKGQSIRVGGVLVGGSRAIGSADGRGVEVDEEGARRSTIQEHVCLLALVLRRQLVAQVELQA